MALSPEEVAHLNRQAKRRAERAAAEMSFRDVTSEEYLKKLRAKRRPGRRFEVEDIPAAVEVGEEPLPPSQPEFRRPMGPERQRTHTRTQSAGATIPGPQQRAASTPGYAWRPHSQEHIRASSCAASEILKSACVKSTRPPYAGYAAAISFNNRSDREVEGNVFITKTTASAAPIKP
ncbi:hypothetical protein ColTof4_11596 [Colletotrichum tofieldiae]|nr:hypothetical protein ColTof3_03333 [Colletotrichum tofieldiae]GKT79173.1 hypothetical protein ColTof4_11596 [Colletotrichum tofieldiae]